MSEWKTYVIESMAKAMCCGAACDNPEYCYAHTYRDSATAAYAAAPPRWRTWKSRRRK